MALEDNQLLLIVRHLNNPAHEVLADSIKNWREQDPENERYYQDIYKLWQASGEASVLQQIDVAEAVAQLTARINQHEPVAEPKVVRMHPLRSLLKWATGVAALLLVAIGIFRHYHKMAPALITRTTNGLKDSVLLSDGSTIYLDTYSAISYPVQFVADNRKVAFLKGNAFFKIASDSARPFTITIDRAAVQVLGTSFNIRKEADSINVDVKTGRVMLLANDQPQAILSAGNAARYDLRTDSLTTFSNQNQNSDAWLTGELRFIDEPLSKVFEKLEDHYHVKIDLDTNLSNLGKLNATFVNNNLDEVITLLQRTYPIVIVKKGNRLVIKNNKH